MMNSWLGKNRSAKELISRGKATATHLIEDVVVHVQSKVTKPVKVNDRIIGKFTRVEREFFIYYIHNDHLNLLDTLENTHLQLMRMATVVVNKRENQVVSYRYLIGDLVKSVLDYE